MTNKEIEMIEKDDRFVKVFWENGVIYTKMSLIEIRVKRFNNVFKGMEWHIRPCSKTEYLMHQVAILHNRLKARDRWYKSRGYIKVYYPNEIGYKFLNLSYEWHKKEYHRIKGEIK